MEEVFTNVYEKKIWGNNNNSEYNLFFLKNIISISI